MNVVLTSYFNTVKDTQRDVFWPSDKSQLKVLSDSCKKYSLPFFVFTDCLLPDKQDYATFITYKPKASPYFARWAAYLTYLENNKDVQKVLMMDATDTEVLQSPFKYMQDRIYVGDESQKLGTPWLVDNHTERFMQDFFTGRKDKILNVGLLGGSRERITKLLKDFMQYSKQYDGGLTDMAIYNYILYTKYKGIVTHGAPFNTTFRKEERTEGVWLRHK